MAELSEGKNLDTAIDERRVVVRAAVRGTDAANALGQVVLSESIQVPNEYAESTSPGQAYVVELVAAELLAQAGDLPAVVPTEASVLAVAQNVREAAHEAVFLEGLRRYSPASGDAPESAAQRNTRGRAALKHLMLRNPGWPWQEHDVLRGVFGDEATRAACRTDLGFDVDEAIACSEASTRLLGEKQGEHAETTRAAVETANVDHPATSWIRGPLGRPPAPNEVGYAIATWGLAHIGQGLLINASDLAIKAQVDRKVADAYLRALSTAPQDVRGEGDWFEAAERVRAKPFIECRSGEFLLCVPGADLWALRDLLAGPNASRPAFHRNRGRWLEDEVSRRFTETLRPDEVHRSVRFNVKEANGAEKTLEIDCLMRFGDIAVVVEAKSALLNASRRRGGNAFLKFVEDNLTKAALQTTRSREALTAGVALRDTRGEDLRLGERITETHAVVVTLEDLTPVAPVYSELAGTRFLPEGTTPPWTVTLSELELVSSTIEWPAQLIHFLQRRAKVSARPEIRAMDELDWWMHYLTTGLFFDDQRGPIRLASLTDPLDAWVLFERGVRTKSAPKPEMALEPETRAILDVLDEERETMAFTASCLLLEPNSDARADFWTKASDMRKRAEAHGKIQRMTLGFSDGQPPMALLMVVTPEAQRPDMRRALEALIEERREELPGHRVLAVATSASSRRAVDVIIAER